jgi:UMF1 family MFS transporter
MSEQTETHQPDESELLIAPSRVPRREVFAWATYDIANSTYATVVATAIYNAYFVNVVAGSQAAGHSAGFGTLLLTVAISVAALLIVLTAPVLGSIADATASKKKLLAISTFICIGATASLAFVGPGDYIAGMLLLIVSNASFGTAEDFVASFLPEIATKAEMGRISALGWGAGYVGGLFSLGSCLAFVYWATHHGMKNTEYVPMIIVGVAVFYTLVSLPTFLVLKERAKPDPSIKARDFVRVGFQRLARTFHHARHYQDLFNILLTICVYSCGTGTVVHLASVYAQETLHFTQMDSLIMILVVDVTAAIGAFSFGAIQDRIGSVKTLSITLLIWTVAIIIAYLAQTKMELWIAGNIVGLAMGASGSAGRALVGRFSPEGRSGEFLGLWGVAVKLATAIGAISFGLVTYLSNSNFRVAMLSTVIFFIGGFFLLLRVNEERGMLAAASAEPE